MRVFLSVHMAGGIAGCLSLWSSWVIEIQTNQDKSDAHSQSWSILGDFHRGVWCVFVLGGGGWTMAFPSLYRCAAASHQQDVKIGLSDTNVTLGGCMRARRGEEAGGLNVRYEREECLYLSPGGLRRQPTLKYGGASIRACRQRLCSLMTDETFLIPAADSWSRINLHWVR